MPIVVGGSGASLSPEGIFEVVQADYIVVSNGEVPFVQLLSALENGGSPENIPGVGMRRDGRFHLSPPELKDVPPVRVNLGKWIDMKPYQRSGSSYNIQTKRGCTEKCIYCTYNRVLEGSRLRLRSPVDVVDEVEEALFTYHPESFEFVDSVFNQPFNHCTAILEEIVKRPWEAQFTAMGVSPKNVNDQFLDLMWRAGFTSFMMTPEAASETMLKSYQKGFSLDDVIKAAEAVRKTRFTTLWYFLIGGPGETNETLQETLDFTMKYLRLTKRPPYNMANFWLGVRIYPRTPLWHMAREEGFVNDSSDPLDQLWYLSEKLDLGLAIKQMTEAAKKCPEISLGFDERLVSVTGMIGLFGELFKMPKPYWRHIWGMNQILIKTGLRYLFGPPKVVPLLQKYLARQGYRGPLLDQSS
ncbi:MAG: radical SAM protein [Deltaproteobacteria bacterium]